MSLATKKCSIILAIMKHVKNPPLWKIEIPVKGIFLDFRLP